MTIKQHGGVFGRNPTFNDVDVENNLTVDGTFTHTGTQDITGQLNVDNLRLDGNTISSINANGSIILDANGTGIVDAKDRVRAQVQSGATNNTQPDAVTVSNITTGAHAAGLGSSVRFEYVNSGGGYAGPRISAESLGDPFGADLVFYGRYYGDVEGPRVKAITGNLSFPSGKGIDFSATSGTGTSELFDDYEEGTWTPTINGTAASSGSAWYIKTGSMVTIGFNNIVSIASIANGAGFTTSGLPFNVKSGGPSIYTYGAAASMTFADASASYVMKPLVARITHSTNNNLQCANQSGVATSTSDGISLLASYVTD